MSVLDMVLVAGVDFVQFCWGVGGGGGGDGFERAECGAGLVAVQPVMQGAACGFVGAGVGGVGVCEDAEEDQGDDGEGVFHGGKGWMLVGAGVFCNCWLWCVVAVRGGVSP